MREREAAMAASRAASSTPVPGSSAQHGHYARNGTPSGTRQSSDAVAARRRSVDNNTGANAVRASASSAQYGNGAARR